MKHKTRLRFFMKGPIESTKILKISSCPSCSLVISMVKLERHITGFRISFCPVPKVTCQSNRMCEMSVPCNIFTAFIFVDLLILIQSNVQETQWKMQGLKTKRKLTQYHLIVDELYTIHSDCNAKPECQSNLSLN